MTTAQEILESQFPGRSKQIATLLREMQPGTGDAQPSSIFVYGHPSSGKTSVVKAVMEHTLPRTQWAYINCVECHTPRLIFEHALNQWCDWSPSFQNNFTGVCRVENIHQFIRAIQDGVNIDENTNIKFGDDKTHYLILDRAERLRDMGNTLFSVLLRLSEMSGKNICVIMLSTIVFEKFRSKGGAYFVPQIIRFPEYTKDEILRILQLDFRASGRRIPVETQHEEDNDNYNDDDEENASSNEPKYIELDSEFFAVFAEQIYQIFHLNCKDLNELRYITALLLPIYIKPLRDGRAQKHETYKLSKYSQPYFAQTLDKLYLREISSAEWGKETRRIQDAKDTTQVDTSFTARSRRGDFELPYYTKFLLIAAFLASYNPPRYDVRYFSRNAEERRKKRGGGAAKSKEMKNLGGKMRPQLLGPKAFPVERMLAIFYSIIDNSLEDTFNIQMQLTSLTTLRLLVRANNMDRLDAAKYKCNVGFDFIKAVAASVRFEIGMYLYDFS